MCPEPQNSSVGAAKIFEVHSKCFFLFKIYIYIYQQFQMSGFHLLKKILQNNIKQLPCAELAVLL